MHYAKVLQLANYTGKPHVLTPKPMAVILPKNIALWDLTVISVYCEKIDMGRELDISYSF